MPLLPIALPPTSAPVRIESFLRRDAATERTLAGVGAKAGLPEADFALAFGRLDAKGRTIAFGSLRGGERFYPASVVKLFYMACLQERLEAGAIRTDPELVRAERDMIRESSNDGTALVLDTLTGTTGGPSLAPRPLGDWMRKRAAVDGWLTARGFTGVIARQKPWNEGPYGREKQGYGVKNEWRNATTADACLAMMAGVDLEVWHTPARRTAMLGLLARDPKSDQGFILPALPAGWKGWSKAGWTSEVSHDVLLGEAPSGERVIVVVLLRGKEKSEARVGTLGRGVIDAFFPAAQ